LVQRVLGRLVGSGRGGKAPSLQIDVARGRPRSEVEFLNGSVVGHADRLGLPVPVNRFLTKTLLAITSGRISWETYRHKPKAVLDALCAAEEQDDEGFDSAQ
jgi:2-dehydropantoate 2-reductase